MKKYLMLGLTIAIIGCKKKNVGPTHSSPANIDQYNILVGCEGNFGMGNGSVSAYDMVNNQVTNNYFYQVNGYTLGDVVQSIEKINGNIYIVVNNSGKIEVIDTANFETQSVITAQSELERVLSAWAVFVVAGESLSLLLFLGVV